ncbi:MAG: HPP family protein [Stellaceae bacterium]
MGKKRLTASDIMTQPVESATAEDCAQDVALRLLSGIYRGVPVIDDRGSVVGVVTELDLLKAAEKGTQLLDTTAEKIMSRKVPTADVKASINDLVGMMTDKKVVCVPTTKGGKLVGVVTRHDLLKALIEHA